jgi:hypothetical protein
MLTDVSMALALVEHQHRSSTLAAVATSSSLVAELLVDIYLVVTFH